MLSAIEVVRVSNTFRIPHEQRTYFKEYFVHPFRLTTYERNEALKDVTFPVEAGEFLGIIEPNGSGKSTLLRILAGIYVPEVGRVRTHGFCRRSSSSLDERVDEILAFSELERSVDQKLKNYSSGMFVRLAYFDRDTDSHGRPPRRRGACRRG
jgi:ABC-type polysaccharide/polyol phosphate transport system ATPase subunit